MLQARLYTQSSIFPPLFVEQTISAGGQSRHKRTSCMMDARPLQPPMSSLQLTSFPPRPSLGHPRQTVTISCVTNR